MGKLKEIIYRLRGEYTTEKLIKMGLKVGRNFGRLNGVILDPSHCWLISIGDNVTMAPRVHILCHDASTKQFLGYTKIGRVDIGDNVFIGAESVVLPGVSIENNWSKQHSDKEYTGQYGCGRLTGKNNLFAGRISE